MNKEIKIWEKEIRIWRYAMKIQQRPIKKKTKAREQAKMLKTMLNKTSWNKKRIWDYIFKRHCVPWKINPEQPTSRHSLVKLLGFEESTLAILTKRPGNL